MDSSHVLTSWKEIAAYLNKGVRTVQRWEAELNLPVRRPNESQKNTVVAVPAELDRWMANELSIRQGKHQQQRPGAGLEAKPDSKTFSYRALVVDDSFEFRSMTRAVLESEGYEVVTAEDGFAGLAALKMSLPDIILSDLRMPNMSGFEFLSVVRQRFPRLPVIAISGDFSGIGVPGSVLADGYLEKGTYTGADLLATIASLLQSIPSRPREGKLCRAPVWIPNAVVGRFVVVTCPDCLRTFPALRMREITAGVHHAPCDFCSADVSFEIAESEAAAHAAD